MSQASDDGDLKAWYSALSRHDKMRFLAHLVHEVTLLARGPLFMNAPSGDAGILALKVCSEVSQRASGELLHHLDATPQDKMYPDAVLISILLDEQEKFGQTQIVSFAISRAREAMSR